MMRLERQAQALLARAYYQDSAQPWERGPALAGTVQADVCIVGGGLAGLSAALELARAGMKTVLLEAQQVGWGASGRNGGQALAGYASEMEPFERQLGHEAARQAWALSLEALDLMRARIRTHCIACDWTDGAMTLAVRPAKARALRAWYEHMQAHYGAAHLRWLDEAQTRAQVQSERYVAGVFDPLSGHVHPLNYTRGIARAARAAGAQIFEGSEAVQVQAAAAAGGGKARVRTAQGEVRAHFVLLAGNVHLGRVAPALARRVMPVGTYIIATEPLGAERAAALIPSRACVSDSQFVLDYYRLSADERLLFGGRVSYSTVAPPELPATMRRGMLRVFPQLHDVRVTHAWGGFVDVTVNRAPDFGRLAPDVLYLQGFSGHGLALTGLAGQLAAEAIRGQVQRFDLFARLRHRPFPGGDRLRTPLLVLAMAWYRLRDAL